MSKGADLRADRQIRGQSQQSGQQGARLSPRPPPFQAQGGHYDRSVPTCHFSFMAAPAGGVPGMARPHFQLVALRPGELTCPHTRSPCQAAAPA